MNKLILSVILMSLMQIKIVAAEPTQIVVPTSTTTSNFVLYPTTNIYTFLKLDTRNGKIWQLQYSMDESEEFEVNINNIPLATPGKPGQFALYPTQNMWTFLLLDTLNGTVWHVQWSLESEKRFVLPPFMSL